MSKTIRSSIGYPSDTDDGDGDDSGKMMAFKRSHLEKFWVILLRFHLHNTRPDHISLMTRRIMRMTTPTMNMVSMKTMTKMVRMGRMEMTRMMMLSTIMHHRPR